ncbi:MAG TPA: transketolase C-terminal domain-containing protein, partial [Methylotenera sp.]|nr:transketolase C-terminal domain-containing protein [Methylotenera sp.]
GTFHQFTDYMRNGMRMSALMHQRVVYVLTHDSIGQGEDGPTHQPIETTAGLRYIPRMDVWRPGSATETAVAWVVAAERTDGPTSLVLSRQNVSGLKHDAKDFAGIRRGGYVLSEVADAQVTLIGTGSELEIAVKAAAELNAAGVKTRVVSMPSTNVFDRQDAAYKASVLGTAKRVAIEAGVTDFWRKYVGLEGAVVGIDTFGESAPGGVLYKHFGFTPENLVAVAKSVL